MLGKERAGLAVGRVRKHAPVVGRGREEHAAGPSTLRKSRGGALLAGTRRGPGRTGRGGEEEHELGSLGVVWLWRAAVWAGSRRGTRRARQSGRGRCGACAHDGGERCGRVDVLALGRQRVCVPAPGGAHCATRHGQSLAAIDRGLRGPRAPGVEHAVRGGVQHGLVKAHPGATQQPVVLRGRRGHRGRVIQLAGGLWGSGAARELVLQRGEGDVGDIVRRLVRRIRQPGAQHAGELQVIVSQLRYHTTPSLPATQR